MALSTCHQHTPEMQIALMRIQRLRDETMTRLHVDAHLSSYAIHHRGGRDAANRRHDASTILTATHQRRARATAAAT